MFGLRSRYALTNILIANLRQNMHFALRAGRLARERAADAEPRPALRIRDAVGGEGQHPVELRSGDPHDGAWHGRIAAGALDRQPGSQQLRAAPGRSPSRSPETVLRGGYGISYVHFHRAGGANVLPINGPQVINAVVNQTPTPPDFRPTEQGYPAGLTDPSHVRSAGRRTSPTCPRTTSRAGCRAGSFRCSASCRRTLVDLAYVGNRADDLLLFANFNQAVPNNAAGTLVASGAPADPRVRRHHLLVQRRDLALPQRSRPASTADAVGVQFLNSLTLSKAEDNGARLAREPERQLPGAAGLLQPGRRGGTGAYDQPYNNTTSVVWDCRSAGPPLRQ